MSGRQARAGAIQACTLNTELALNCRVNLPITNRAELYVLSKNKYKGNIIFLKSVARLLLAFIFAETASNKCAIESEMFSAIFGNE
jgi:hypothetical protein